MRRSHRWHNKGGERAGQGTGERAGHDAGERASAQWRKFSLSSPSPGLRPAAGTPERAYRPSPAEREGGARRGQGEGDAARRLNSPAYTTDGARPGRRGLWVLSCLMVWMALPLTASAAPPDGLASVFKPAVAPEAIQAQPLFKESSRQESDKQESGKQEPGKSVPWVVVVACAGPAGASASPEPCSRLYGVTQHPDGTWGGPHALGASEPLYNPRMIPACEGPSAPSQAAQSCVPAVLVLRQAGAAAELLDVVGTRWFGLKRLDRVEAERFEWDARAHVWVAHARALVLDVPRLLRWQGGRFQDVSQSSPEWYRTHLPNEATADGLGVEARLDGANWKRLAGDRAGACEVLRQLKTELSPVTEKAPEKAFMLPAVNEQWKLSACGG